MTTDLHNLCRTLLSQWLETSAAPDAPVEGVTPEFGEALDVQPQAFTFDACFHQTPTPEWAWRSIEFSDIFDGQFFFYLPETWSVVAQAAQTAAFGVDGAARLALQLGRLSDWRPFARNWLDASRIIGFAYYPLHRPHYHHWLVVTGADEGRPRQVYAVYSSGDWLVATQGDAPTAADLNVNLTALINSNPWYGWIRAAKAQSA